MTPAEFLTIARLRKTQGRHGEIAAEILTDFPERFSERKRVFLLAAAGTRSSINIENHWFHKGGVILKFSGIDSISDAEALLGLQVQIPASEAAPLEPGMIFVHDLVGCSLFDSTSRSEIGVIDDVVPSAGSAPLLIVKGIGPQPAEHMIPFAADYLGNIDIASKRIEMKLPTGLLDVDRPDYDDGLLPADRAVSSGKSKRMSWKHRTARKAEKPTGESGK